MELKTQIVEMDNSSKFQNAIQWFKYKTEMWNCWTDLKFNYQNCWRRNLHDHTIKSQSISHQYQINIFNQYPIHFSNQHFNQHPINILHEKMIEMLIVKSTYQINVWEDQHIVCNHFNARNHSAVSQENHQDNHPGKSKRKSKGNIQNTQFFTNQKNIKNTWNFFLIFPFFQNQKNHRGLIDSNQEATQQA